MVITAAPQTPAASSSSAPAPTPRSDARPDAARAIAAALRTRAAQIAAPFGMASQVDAHRAEDEARSSSAALEAADASPDDAALMAQEEAAWKEKEKNYQGQILALEEEQATLRDAWSDIVRTNLAAADDLRAQLNEQQTLRDEAQVQADAVLGELESQHNHLVAELAAAKLRVAELSDQRDRAHHRLAELARGGRL